jgi:GT2 family glycosyltransferase
MCDPRDVDGALQYGDGAKEAVRLAARSVSVCIVNFNSGTFLAECVDAVLRSTKPLEVLVSDNGSSDNSIRLLRERIGDDAHVQIIENQRNLGFAKAANIALRRSTGDFCLLLNPDCLVLPDALERVASHFSTDPEVGLVGCLIRNPDGSEQAGARRSVPTPWRSLVRVLHLDKWLPPHPRLRTFLHVFDPIPDRPINVEAISGAFMLVSRRALVQVGLLDEGYFLHCEDLDWCMRVRRAGWKIAFVPDAEVIHYKGTCSRSRPIFVEWHKHRGMVRFYCAHFRHQYPWPLMPLVAVAVWTRFLLVMSCILVARAGLRRTPEFLLAEPSFSRAATRLPVYESVAGGHVLECDADESRWSGGDSGPKQSRLGHRAS